MKIFSKIRLNAPKVVFFCFLFALTYVLTYEIFLIEIPGSFAAEKGGYIFSKSMYSILASSIFYFFSVYIPIHLPRENRKRKILYNTYLKTLLIVSEIQNFKYRLGVETDDYNKLSEKLSAINPDHPAGEFDCWYSYFHYFKAKILDLVRSITIYQDYLSEGYLQELILIENNILSQYSFEGFKRLNVSNLHHARIPIHEVLVHSRLLQEKSEKEYGKYKKQFNIDTEKYRKQHYNE